jgi:hypothetical protein
MFGSWRRKDNPMLVSMDVGSLGRDLARIGVIPAIRIYPDNVRRRPRCVMLDTKPHQLCRFSVALAARAASGDPEYAFSAGHAICCRGLDGIEDQRAPDRIFLLAEGDRR